MAILDAKTLENAAARRVVRRDKRTLEYVIIEARTSEDVSSGCPDKCDTQIAVVVERQGRADFVRTEREINNASVGTGSPINRRLNCRCGVRAAARISTEIDYVLDINVTPCKVEIHDYGPHAA